MRRQTSWPHPPGDEKVARGRRQFARFITLAGTLQLGLREAVAQTPVVMMRGFTSATATSFWLQADDARPLELRWWPVDGRAPTAASVTVTPEAAADYVVQIPANGLLPGQRYRYSLHRASETQTLYEGTFVTPAITAATALPALTIAFGSCVWINEGGPEDRRPPTWAEMDIFERIAELQPDCMLWLGDNVYFRNNDLRNEAGMNRRYRLARAFKPMQRLLASTSHLAVWDDHDYGPNDSGAAWPLREASLNLFKRYWPNPSFGLPDTPGVFSSVRLGDAELFLLDDRYYRDDFRAPQHAGKVMYGARQMAWLRESLQRSGATFKIIASGSQQFNPTNRWEGWHHYADEQREFLAFIAQARIDGLVFLSGDRHFGQLLRIERAEGYPLLEFTSSPLMNSAFATPPRIEVDNPQAVADSTITTRNFGIVRLTGASPAQRVLTLEAYDALGHRLWQHAVAAAELRHPAR